MPPLNLDALALFDQADAALRADRVDIASKHSAAQRNPQQALAMQRQLQLQKQQQQQQQQQRPDPFMGNDDSGTTAAAYIADDDEDNDDNQHRVHIHNAAAAAAAALKPEEIEFRLPRLPLPTLKDILREGRLYHQVMKGVLDELQKYKNHLHHGEVSSGVDSENAASSTSSASSSFPPKGKFLKSFAKSVAQPGPNMFPALFEHFLSLVSRSQQAMCALAVFADCSGPAVLVEDTTTHSSSNRNQNVAAVDPIVQTQQSLGSVVVNGAVNALVVAALPEPIRRQAELLVYTAAVDCGRVAHVCPATLVGMMRSREWNARIGECVTREMERLHREVLAIERKRNQVVAAAAKSQKQHQHQHQQQQQQDDDSAVDPQLLFQRQQKQLDDQEKEVIARRSDGLRAIFSAQAKLQSVLTDRGMLEAAASVAGAWLLFVRMQIAPRVLKWAAQIADPVGDAAEYMGASNDILNKSSFSSSGNSEEDVWTAFNRLYRKVLLPCLSGCDCDSVRTVQYRALLVFEARMRRQHNVVVGGSVAVSGVGADGAAAADNNNGVVIQQDTGGGVAGKRTMSDMAEDALARSLGAAVYAASFTTATGGHQILVAEGGGLKGGPIQFYVAEKVHIWAKRGKLRGSAPFQKMATIDELVKFAAASSV